MPSKQGVGCHDGSNLSEHPSSQRFGPNSQATPLIIIEPHWSTPELFAADAILLTQIVYDLTVVDDSSSQPWQFVFGICAA